MRSTEVEALYIVVYGNCIGFALATLIGVGRSARETIYEIKGYSIPNPRQIDSTINITATSV